MAGYRSTIRPPEHETEFEKNCVVLFRELLNDQNVKRVGRRGQKQDGIDLIGHRDQRATDPVGIQCKLKSLGQKLKAQEVRMEVKAALARRPKLVEYFIVTTAGDDTKLDRLAGELMQAQAAKGRKISINIWGWNTLQEKINQYEAAKQAFDTGFSPALASQNRKIEAVVKATRNLASKQDVANLGDRLARTSEEVATRLPARFADRELRAELKLVLRRRNFGRTDVAGELAALANRAIAGDLVYGSDSLRAEACDRAARANASAKTLDEAKCFRDYAKQFDPTRDLAIASAVIKEAEGDGDTALLELRVRTDLESRSALFLSLSRQRGAEGALDWFENEHLQVSDLSPPGALNVVLTKIKEGNFEGAQESIASIPSEYLDQCPAFLLLRAQLALASVLPVDRRAVLFQGLAMNPRQLQFAGGPESQKKIQAARADIHQLRSMLPELQVEFMEPYLAEFELWLGLEDETVKAETRKQLEKEIADPALTLQRVRLALAYDVPFNVEALQRHLNAQKDMGGWTPDERFASYLIAYNSGDARRLADFYDRHHADLFAQSELERTVLAGIEIEALARTGRYEEARQRAAEHRGKHLTDIQVDDMLSVVSHIEIGDEIEEVRRRYNANPTLSDLRVLVAELRTHRDHTQLATYAPALARETKAREDFDVAIKALFRAERFGEVLTLTSELPDLLGLDVEYESIKGWALLRLGRVKEAAEIARSLISQRVAASDRELAINTAIEMGDWGNLQATLAMEASRAETLPARDLIRLARLALEAASPYVDLFRDAALKVAPDDPQVNLAAYMLATERGEEYLGSEAHQWFEKAVRLSGPEGPVQSMSLREIVDQTPQWNERVEKFDDGLRRAEFPLFIAAKGVRRQLLDLTLGQAIRNTDSDDDRIRYPVFAFSGASGIRDLSAIKSLGIDVSALITLDFLGLLDKTFAQFDRIVVAPTALSELFTERQFLRFHQPSQLAKATRLQELLSADRLKVISADPKVPDGAKEMGADLARLLAEARNVSGIVVRSSPVTKVGSFLDERVDMTPYSDVLSDTLSVVSFLSSHGKIDLDTKREAESYLKQVDQGWSPAQAIEPSSTLFLDDLAVTYLDHIGILKVLTQSVAAVFVHPDLDKQARETIRYAKQVDDLLAAIERIRVAMYQGVVSGKVAFSSRKARDADGSESGEEDEAESTTSEFAPTIDLLSDLSSVEAIVTDDRALNKHANWSDSSGRTVPAVTTLSLLVALRASGALPDALYWRARHTLRAAGFYAMTLQEGELEYHLASAPISDKSVRETPELRAISESLALPLINRCYLATEHPWLNGIRFAIFKALRDIWLAEPVSDHAEALSDWVLSISPDPRAWSVESENDAVWQTAQNQTVAQAALLLVFPYGDLKLRRRYSAWADERIAKPLRSQDPQLWDAALEFLKQYIERLVESGNED